MSSFSLPFFFFFFNHLCWHFSMLSLHTIVYMNKYFCRHLIQKQAILVGLVGSQTAYSYVYSATRYDSLKVCNRQSRWDQKGISIDHSNWLIRGLREYNISEWTLLSEPVRNTATDIGNAYLEAETREKVYIIAGPEFEELEGHVLVICKALYGLHTSGLCWHECFADCLWAMGFTPSKAEHALNNTIY